MKRAVLVVVAALAFAPSAFACNAHPSLPQLEGQVMCPVCGTTLDQSDSPAAQQIKRAIRTRIMAGQSDCVIKDALVANYGPAILAAPQKSGFGLLAWWLPIAGIVLAAVAIGVAAWRWTRQREPEATFDPSQNGHAALDPALERRLDEELARFDG
ncbi:MAG: cytochrome c-type biogenesis protein CcmH [Actinobacteria bacterium]|nr:MAG: cytochrome c-type biogenesis protein CcmH [Actinomycetota bacterium]